MNGRATLTGDPGVLAACALDGRAPKVAVVVEVEEAFIHCAKAFRRGAVWQPEQWPDTADMATVACMLADHVGLEGVEPEVVAEVLEDDYRASLWKEGGHDGPS